MKTNATFMAFAAASLLLSAPLFSQETNKNDARRFLSRGMSIFFSPVYNSPMDKGTDSLLFRGSGAGIKFGGDYFFGNVGLGMVSGFSSSAADDALINDFLKRNSIPQDQLVINKSSQQSMYLLIGPSLRWGKSVQLFAHAKGGLFINNGGLVNIQQKGATRSIYRNEATTKSIYPGFQTGVGIQYSNKSDTWSFGFGADYMSTKTQVQNFDLRRGGGFEGLKLSRNISDLMAGVSIRYTIKSPRDAASGLATGRRTRDAASGLPTGRRSTMSNRDAASGLATGRRTRDAASGLPTGRRSTMTTRDAASGLPTGRRSSEIITEEVEIIESGANCGPVTQRVTNPDGSTSEMTFACPDDAAAYLRKINGGMPNRISMNVTVPKQTQGATFGEKVNQGLQSAGGNNAGKQTQGATFGEKVNAGLHAAGGALAQGKNIISGNVSWATEGSSGIVTNKTVTKLAGGAGGGAAQASYAATGMVVNNPSPGIGSVLTLYSRDASSGQASGRRDKGSGQSTGRRQYQPFYREGSGNACDTCSTAVRLSSVQNNPYFAGNDLAGENVQMINGHNNPAFTESQMAGTMAKSGKGYDQDCDGLAGLDVYLKDPYSGAVVAKTTTTACGDFFFANVPDGDYVVALTGTFLSRKGYQYYMAKSDMRGMVESAPAALQLFLNTGGEEEEPVQKAGISTSRSNIRNKTLTIIEADTDGDGEYEALRANATFSDGSSADISSSIKKSPASGGSPSLTIDEAGTQRRRVEVLKSNRSGNPNARRLTGISVAGTGNTLRATATFSDGSSSDITESLEVNNAHNGVRQYSVTVTDLDGDGHADAVLKTRTKSNQTNERMAATADEEEIWSPRSNIKTIPVFTGDLDDDGTAELLGGALPGGAVISAAVSRQAGGPIGGIIVKGGKNPGGQMRTTTTDENGEFEFTDLEEGSYSLSIEQKLIINDETFVSVGGGNRAQDHNSSRSNKSSSVAPDPGSGGGGGGGNKAQDHNSSRSNKSSSVAPDPGSGGGGSGGSKAQDHNSTRSNKTASVIDNDLDNGDGSFRKGDVKVTASQNTQSLRTISVQADLDGDGIYETDVTSKISDELILDKEGNLTEPQQKTGISTSRSNIRNRSSLQPVTQTVFTGYGTTTINGNEVEVKTVYKVVEKATSGLKDTLKTQVSIRPAKKYSPTV